MCHTAGLTNKKSCQELKLKKISKIFLQKSFARSLNSFHCLSTALFFLVQHCSADAVYNLFRAKWLHNFLSLLKLYTYMVEIRNNAFIIYICFVRSFVALRVYINCNILKAPSSAFLISRYILRLGQAAQKKQRPRKMYLEIRRADEWLLNLLYYTGEK